MKQLDQDKKSNKRTEKAITRSYASFFINGASMMNQLEKKFNYKSVWVSRIFFRGEKLKGKNS